MHSLYGTSSVHDCSRATRTAYLSRTNRNVIAKGPYSRDPYKGARDMWQLVARVLGEFSIQEKGNFCGKAKGGPSSSHVSLMGPRFRPC